MQFVPYSGVENCEKRTIITGNLPRVGRQAPIRGLWEPEYTLINSLLLNLESRDVVSSQEKDILRNMIRRERHFSIDEDIVSQGSRPQYSSLLIEGFAARYKLMADGSRQITALHIAGDFVDLHAFPFKVMDHGILALSPCRVGFADHGDLKVVTETQPHLTRLLWLLTLVDAAIHREWIVAMGRRSKISHLAHLVCELFLRLRVVHKTDGQTFHFPLSQSELADVLGVSTVYLNKTLQTLRRQDVLTWINQEVRILDWEGLTATAEFEPTYLNHTVEPR